MTPRLKETFKKAIQQELKNKFGYKNIYMVPEIKKIVINMGLGLDGNDNKILKSCEDDMSKITGQKPVVTKFENDVPDFSVPAGEQQRVIELDSKPPVQDSAKDILSLFLVNSLIILLESFIM